MSGPPPIRLHSRFDPAGEALRYLDRSLAGRHPSCILVLGGGEDWLSEAARARFPSSLILSVQYDASLRGGERPGADALWYPDQGMPLPAFLAERIPGRLDGGVAVADWKPSERLHPETAEKVLREVRRFLEEATSDAATVRYWARRWIRNAVRNFLDAELYASPARGSAPIVVAAAGPSLEEALRALSPFRGRTRLWALASAAGACLRAGWEPELLVSTDPGYWAERHFDAVLRGLSSAPLACHLTAGIPRRIRSRTPLAVLSASDFPENDLADRAGLRAPVMPSRGTAASEALWLARSCTPGAVIAAGLDMAGRDLASHCRPYAFDLRVRAAERRLRPGLSLVWERETAAFPLRMGSWRRSRAFDLYAGGVCPESASGVYRLLPSPVPVPGAMPLDSSGLGDLFAASSPGPDAPPPAETPAPPPERRADIVRSALNSWLRELEAAVLRPDPAPLSPRVRHLLYGLGGPEAAAFLAGAARGLRDESESRRALAAVRLSLRSLEGMLP